MKIWGSYYFQNLHLFPNVQLFPKCSFISKCSSISKMFIYFHLFLKYINFCVSVSIFWIDSEQKGKLAETFYLDGEMIISVYTTQWLFFGNTLYWYRQEYYSSACKTLKDLILSLIWIMLLLLCLQCIMFANKECRWKFFT